MTAPDTPPGPPALDVFSAPLEGATLVEASAGTGKTYAICGLLLRLLLERGLGIQQVLVLTFTNAATAELRDRIRARIASTQQALRAGGLGATAGAAAGADPFVPQLLQQLRDQGLDDALLQTRLDLALQQFDEAAIFTIHGFCQRALADTPVTTGLPLRQDIQADDSALRLQVAQDFWRRHVAAGGLPPALLALLVQQGDSPARWAAQLKRRRAKPLARLCWPAGIDTPTPLDDSALHQAFAAAQAAWAAGRSSFLAQLQAALPGLHKTRFKPPAVDLAIAQWDRLLAGTDPLAEPEPDAKKQRLDRFTPDALVPNKNKPPVGPHPVPACARALLDARAAAREGLQRARLRLLQRWLHEGPAALREAQRVQRVQSYDDLLVNLHARLAPGPSGDTLAASLRARFPAALIDEFQDTDALQYAIFRRIYPPGAAALPLFFVGDPKQAIYSFRNADLRTYLRARSQVQREATLGHNQRSVPALVQAVNALFSRQPQPFRLAELPFRPVGVGSKPRTPLFEDAAEGSARPAPAALQLWALPAEAPWPKADALAASAAATAGEIVRLLQAAQAGRLRLGPAPVRADDIAVLVRSHRQGALMRQALLARGVASVELSQASLFDSPDAEELATVLAAVLQPARSGGLRAALATDLLGLDAAALLALDSDEAASARHAQALAGLRSLWAERGIGVMLRQLQARYALPARLLARPDGERRLTNLLHLAECLQQAEREHPAPAALLRWLQQQRQDLGARDQEASQLRLASDRHLVRIVTIHRSKGLEYPFVFCPFLWDGAAPAASARLEGLEGVDETDGQAVIDFRSDSAPALKRAAAEEARAELLRLVYVALTRAVQRCWLVVGPYLARQTSAKEATASPLQGLLLGSAAASADASSIAAAWQAFAATLAAAHPGAVSLQPLPGHASGHHPGEDPATVRWAAPAPDPQHLAALPSPAQPPQAWRMGSYSSLMQGARHETAAVDHDRRLLPAAADGLAALAGMDGPQEPGTAPVLVRAGPMESAGLAEADIPASDILHFPRGAAAGECLHAVFEHIDFSNAATWRPAVDAALARHAQSLPGAAPEPVLQMLQDVLHTPLLAGQPLTLAQVGPAWRLNELEFTLPAPALHAGALQALLQRAGLGGPPLAFGALHGHLRGYIDLVFEHGGRFHVLDWKSNHLGLRPADYAPPALAAAMSAQGYCLQQLLYTVALHRWLQARLPQYDYDRHVGPGLYLFVRGVRPGWQDAQGQPCGVHAWRPPRSLVEEASALLGPAADAPGLATSLHAWNEHDDPGT